MIEINNKLIESIPFNNAYESIIQNDDQYETKKEFFDVPGKQHYRLLSYLSTLYNHSIIIDIGTHRGSSATALSYNKTNKIYSFDIVNKIENQNIRNIQNIEFCYDNLFEHDGQQKWKDTILQAPFIFLDVDPHNGTMEWDFYNFLKSINYQGFVICDDIWYFKEMRNEFWYKIPYEERYDVSEFGHFSGTGIFTFNRNIQFAKRDNSQWTLVTAYFNLAKCVDASKEIKERDQSYYLSHSYSCLSLPYNLVIYTDYESLPLIQQIRPHYLKDKTLYILWDFENISFTKNGSTLKDNFSVYRNKINQNRIEKPYHFDNRNTASYYLFCLSRYSMLKDIITRNPFQSTHFGWINICIERMGIRNVVLLDEALSLKRDKFSTVYIDYIPESLVKNTHEYFRFGRCSMCSGFFTGNAEYMYKVCDLIENKFLQFVEQGYGHADEQLYSPVYFENPHLFEQYYGDYQQMISNYVYAYDKPEKIIHCFINNSFHHKNFIKCKEACEFVAKTVFMGKCNLDEHSLFLLKHFYAMSSFKLLYSNENRS
jgi:predicted O-methyltransferase YrrM